jgi:hypothetical protein
VVTSVVSATAPIDLVGEIGAVAAGGELFGLAGEEAVVDGAANPAPEAEVALESANDRFAGSVLDGGNSNCETAIAISERKRARKKRLSIQGTGS